MQVMYVTSNNWQQVACSSGHGGNLAKIRNSSITAVTKSIIPYPTEVGHLTHHAQSKTEKIYKF